VVDDWTALRGRRHADTAYGINNLGDIIWHRAKPKGSDVWDQQLLAEAEQIFREALDIRMEVLGENHPDTYFSIYAIGSIEMDTGRYEQAEQTMRRVLAFRERTLDPHNGYVLTSLNTVGVTLKRQQRHAEAAEMFAEALRRTRATGFDPEHPDSRMYRNNFIGELRKMDDQPRLREAYLEYFQWLEQSLESDALKTPVDRARRASLLAWRIATCEIEDLRDGPRAVALARHADEIAPDDSRILHTLAAALAAGGQVQEALAAAERAIALLADDAPPRDRESLQQLIAELQQQLANHQ
jgi:tetratricopeptide (TPR) repeat protein